MWGRTAALVARLTQSLFNPDEFLMQVFVDDPIAVVSGTEQRRSLSLSVLICAWLGLGFPLSFKKGQRGRAVVWIGASITISDSGVVASIK